MRISDWSSDVCSSDLGSRPWLCPTVRRGGCRHAGARPLDNEGNGMRVPRGPGPKSGRKQGGKAGPLKTGPKATASARTAPKAAPTRKATPKQPAQTPAKAPDTGTDAEVKDGGQ